MPSFVLLVYLYKYIARNVVYIKKENENYRFKKSAYLLIAIS